VSLNRYGIPMQQPAHTVPLADLKPGMCTIESIVNGQRTGKFCGKTDGTRLFDAICANEHMPEEPRWICPEHCALFDKGQVQCTGCLGAGHRHVPMRLIDVEAADAAPEVPRSVQRHREQKAVPDDDESWFRG
jgi:hypothetical protein